MKDFRIEKGIPMPPKKGRPSKWPMAQMEVGDSFFVPDAKSATCRYPAIWGKRNGKVFEARDVDGGVRFWRTA